jgi:hypothetical protein
MGFGSVCIPSSHLVLARGVSIQAIARRKRGWLDLAARRLCGDYIVRTEIASLANGRDSRCAMVHGCAQILVLACELLMVLLFMGGRDMLLVRGLKFSLGRLSP